MADAYKIQLILHLPTPQMTETIPIASASEAMSVDFTFLVYFIADNEVVSHAGVKSRNS